MESWTIKAAEQELNNPMSPYYIGKPTVPEQIRGFLNGTGRVDTVGRYNTNYFGPNKKFFLAQPSVDTVQIHNKIRQRKDFNYLVGRVALGTAAVVSLLLLRKIPGVGKLFTTTLGAIGSGIGSTLRGVGKALLWLVKK